MERTKDLKAELSILWRLKTFIIIGALSIFIGIASHTALVFVLLSETFGRSPQGLCEKREVEGKADLLSRLLFGDTVDVPNFNCDFDIERFSLLTIFVGGLFSLCVFLAMYPSFVFIVVLLRG